MTRHEQFEFVESLMDSMQAAILIRILNDSIPAEWDGIELRQYIADKFAAQIVKMEPKRMKRYRNDFTVMSL